jgi:hypothetical protein
MQTITIGRTIYKVEGPTPRYGTYLLTGPRGATYLATPAFMGDAHTFKVLGGRQMAALRVRGNRVLLTDAGGALKVRP